MPAGHNFVRALVTVGTAASYTSLIGLAEVETDVPSARSLSKTTLVEVLPS
jgi:hypothetical protein